MLKSCETVSWKIIKILTIWVTWISYIGNPKLDKADVYVGDLWSAARQQKHKAFKLIHNVISAHPNQRMGNHFRFDVLCAL